MSKVATAVLEPPTQQEQPDRTKPKPAKPWVVIILNDNEHTYQYVMELLRKVFGYPREKCFALADDIDSNGRATVWSGSQEVAELKRDQIKSGGKDFYAEAGPVKWPLGCYIEQMP
jgi:ATP-dependent Clp protease adaptor protein ClpS